MNSVLTSCAPPGASRTIYFSVGELPGGDVFWPVNSRSSPVSLEIRASVHTWQPTPTLEPIEPGLSLTGHKPLLDPNRAQAGPRLLLYNPPPGGGRDQVEHTGVRAATTPLPMSPLLG